MTGKSVCTSNETVFICCFSGCSASFPNGKKLKWHMRVHYGERPFKCAHPGCSKEYTRQFHLTRHVKKSHEAKNDQSKSFKCTQENCGKILSSENAFYKHIKYSHGRRTFQCEQCPKAFTKHQHLKVHSFEHTKILPYPCPEPGCDRAFLLPSRLKAHQNTHKGYPCDAEGCEAVFTKWTLLQKHRKVEHQKQFPCATCGRVFFSKWNLATHAETHSSDRESFCCPHEGCSRFYYQEKNLRQHIRSTHENRQFSCDVQGCTRTFFSKQSLKKHKTCHDPNKPLPQKRPNKVPAKGRRKNFPTKSAAAVLSGYVPTAESERRLLSSDTWPPLAAPGLRQCDARAHRAAQSPGSCTEHSSSVQCPEENASLVHTPRLQPAMDSCENSSQTAVPRRMQDDRCPLEQTLQVLPHLEETRLVEIDTGDRSLARENSVHEHGEVASGPEVVRETCFALPALALRHVTV
uniref:Putative transcription factor 3a protein n=1 Tax=Amblyomma aureolatum TaxID=187763 RepID=A0A1E1XCR0_9ACAR